MTTETRHWQRLRGIEIDPATLSVSGTTLTEAVRSIDGSAMTDVAPLDAPSAGWRMIARPSPSYTLLAAPAEPDASGTKRWWLGQLEHDVGRTRLRFLPGPEPQTWSRAEAARDLELRWPDALDVVTSIDHAVVDIVNRGSGVRPPGPDGFLAIGRLLHEGADGDRGEWVFGFTGPIPPEVVLGPGEYARVPVLISSWEGIAPGHYDLHVTAMGGIATIAPRRVEVTAEDIARRARPRRGRFIGVAR